MVGLAILFARKETVESIGRIQQIEPPCRLQPVRRRLGRSPALARQSLCEPAHVDPSLHVFGHPKGAFRSNARRRRTKDRPLQRPLFPRGPRKEISRANRFDRPLTVVIGDLDLLRNINNTYGHLAGDRVLIGVAQILKGAVPRRRWSWPESAAKNSASSCRKHWQATRRAASSS